MIQERQRRAGGETMQPQRHLRQFHGQRVLVNAIDAALERHAPYNRAVGQLRFVQRPIRRRRARQYGVPDCVNPARQRRNIVGRRPIRQARRRFHYLCHAVGYEVHRGHQKMAAAH